MDGAGKVNIMLTDGTQYSRGQVLLKNSQMNRLCPSKVQTYIQIFRTQEATKSGVSLGVMGMGVLKQGRWSFPMWMWLANSQKLITTQRAFQANSRMVSASDEILMELLRLKR